MYFVQRRPEGHYIAAWEVGEGKFADGWWANTEGYNGWKEDRLLYTINERIGEAAMNTTGYDALEEWLCFERLHLEEARVTELQLFCRYSIEDSELQIEHVHAADRKILERFYSYELTPEFERQLIGAFEDSGVRLPYREYWFFNIDKIVLGEWPLEKIPEHLRDIVKEARGE